MAACRTFPRVVRDGAGKQRRILALAVHTPLFSVHPPVPFAHCPLLCACLEQVTDLSAFASCH